MISDLRAAHGLGVVVERAGDLLDAEVRHRLVDLARELDELGRHVELARPPGQVERVDRQAVPAHAGARVEAHEAERLGRRGVDDLPDVDAHPVAEHRQLVDERDVDRAEDVLEQLRHLGGVRRRHRHELVAHVAVELERALEAGVREPADDLRRVAQRVVGAARVDALGREGDVEVHARGEAGLLEQRDEPLARGARVGGRLEHHELAALQHLGERAARRHERPQVRLAVARSAAWARDDRRLDACARSA